MNKIKVAILYDSKFGNTKQVVEFLMERIQASNHQVRLFRTTETKPQDLLAFQPAVILIGEPTHFGNPARILGKCIKNLGEPGQESTIRKAAIFNCYSITIVCKRIESLKLKVLPKVEIFEKPPPVRISGPCGLISDNWKEDANVFVSAFVTFISAL